MPFFLRVIFFIMDFKRFLYTDYFVSETGIVKNKKGIVLIPQKKVNFLFHDISINRKIRRFGLARMVLICHKFRVDYIILKAKHIDGDNNNNHITNLKWI